MLLDQYPKVGALDVIPFSLTHEFRKTKDAGRGKRHRAKGTSAWLSAAEWVAWALRDQLLSNYTSFPKR